MTRFGRVPDVLGAFGSAHVGRSVFHSAKQPFSSWCEGAYWIPRKIVKSCQLSGQPIFQTISAFPKQGIESHDENACFELFHFFGSKAAAGGVRRVWEAFGKVLKSLQD